MPLVIASEATSRLALPLLKATSAAERSVAVFREENSTAFAARSGTPLSRTYSLQHPGGCYNYEPCLAAWDSGSQRVMHPVLCALCKSTRNGSMPCKSIAGKAWPWQPCPIAW